MRKKEICENCEEKMKIIWELSSLIESYENVIGWYKKMLNKRLRKLEEENKK